MIKIVTPEGYQIRSSYNQKNQRIQQEEMDLQAGIHRTIQYTYDRAGNLVEERDDTGAVKVK